MKMFVLKPAVVLCWVALFALASCDNELDLRNNETEEAQIAENASLGENETDDVLEMLDEVESALDPNAGGRTAGWKYPCAQVTNDAQARIITIDFGDGCAGPYGRQRRGKIFIAYSGAINDGVSNRIITFGNYVVNNRGLSGTIELRDISTNTDGTVQSVKRLTNLTVTFPNGGSMVYNGSRTRTWLEGVRDGDPTNNVFEITGSIEGVATNGRTFTHRIIEPIISDWSCRAAGNFARVAGVVEVERLKGFVSRKRTVDYGDGTCDNQITVTIGNRTFVVTVQE
ncbi:MAG: hypothetical protein MUC38_03770 [Cyclobacteriaceae bacterium]|jgi:hypothetical protein|nr:hypothetical protein [Cyclobacteriaceae bacterium]